VVDALPPERNHVLISGGASSLVEVLEAAPPCATSRNLRGWRSRRDRDRELNARRAALSRIKGGRLTARLRAAGACVVRVGRAAG